MNCFKHNNSTIQVRLLKPLEKLDKIGSNYLVSVDDYQRIVCRKKVNSKQSAACGTGSFIDKHDVCARFNQPDNRTCMILAILLTSNGANYSIRLPTKFIQAIQN